jgi:GT2 family glycosyltransferase
VRDEVLTCLESLERHRGDLRLQIVVVDNGSRDGTAEVVASRHPEVEIVRLGRNAGMPARNEGLRRARGRHRMFIDSDASVTAGALETLVGALDADPSLGLVGPRLVYRDGRRQPSTRRYPPLLLPILRRPPLGRFFEHRGTIRRHLMADEPGDRRRRVEYVLGACQVFRAEAQAAAGEIDRHIWYGHDDADWCFAIRRAGFAIGYVPDAEVVHDYRRSSVRSPVSLLALRQLWAHFYFQAKWWRHRTGLRAEGRAMDAAARDSAFAERVPTTVWMRILR